MRRLAVFLIGVLAAAPALAQTVAGDRFTLNTGPCTLRSGTGNPPPALGKTCDVYLDVGSGSMWTRNAVSGWVLPGGIQGAGTTDRLVQWTGTGSVGDARIRMVGTPAVNMEVDPAGYFWLNPSTPTNIWLGGLTTPYVSPGYTYRTNLGSINNKWLTVHGAELWIETLVAQETAATMGGRLVVAPTTMLSRDLSSAWTAGTTNTIYVKHNTFNVGNVTGPVYGSTLLLESNGRFEMMLVDAQAQPTVTAQGDYAYTVWRNRDGSGADAWYAGDALVDQGVVGNGWLDIYSVRGARCHPSIPGTGPGTSPGYTGCAQYQAGPTIVGNVRVGETNNIYWDRWEPRWAIGDLAGLYGYGANTYGAVFGKPGGARVAIDSGGVTMYDGNNAVRMYATAAGAAAFAGEGSGITNINGGNIQTGTVAANKITAGNGGNYLRNGECRVNANDWVGGAADAGGAIASQAIAGWQLNGEVGTCQVIPNNVNAAVGSTLYAANVKTMPVAPGQRIEVSAYTGLHRVTSVSVYIQWMNASGGTISYDAGQYKFTCPAGNTGGTTLGNTGTGTGSGYCRTWAISAPAPGTATAAAFFIQGNIAAASPYIFFVRAYMGLANATQTEPSEWSPAGMTVIDGGMIATDAILARHILAGSITAPKISVTDLSAISANIGWITAGTINGVTINGTTINGGTVTGGSGTIVLDATGLHFNGNGGNSVIDLNGCRLEKTGSSASVYLPNCSLITEQNLSATAGVNTPSLNVTQHIYFPGMPQGSASPVYHNVSDNQLYRMSSSRRYKENIRPWTPSDPYAVLTLRPVLFDYIGSTAATASVQRDLLGFIAEDVAPIAPEAVVRDQNDQPDAIRDHALTVYLLAALRAMNERLSALEKQK